MKTRLLIFFLIANSVLFAQVCMNVQATDAFGNTQVTVDCDYAINDEVCVDLQVDYNTIPSTDSYDFESIPYNPEIPFTQGTALSPNLPDVNGLVDDKFSQPIPMGFNFCFYNQNFTEIVIGTNGILTFDLDEAGADAPSGISVTNPNAALIDNAIFAVQHDMVFDLNDDSEIYYTTIGTAPCRKFVVNFNNAIIFGCPERSSIQVILSEFTNEIEVHILDKPEHCPNGRDANSLLGIMNSDGTDGISPPGRNTGEWSAQQESWRFFPDGNIPPVVVWFDDQGNEVGTGDQISVCPNRNTNYTVEVQHQSCVDNSLFAIDNIQVNFAAEFPAVENEDVLVCDAGNNGIEEITFSDYNDWISLTNTNNFNFSYYASLANAQDQNNALTSTTINGDTTFYVRIENASNAGCFTITPIVFSFTAAAISLDNLEICDNLNDNVEEEINIVNFVEDLLDGIVYESYSIHLSESDAENEINPITIADLTNNSELWVYLVISEGCEQVVGPIEISFLSSPRDRAAQTIFFEACDVNFNHMEPFDWETEIPNYININNNETFTVHTSFASAENGTRAQTQISDAFETYYIRIENRNGCFNIIELPVEVEFYGVDAQDLTVPICFDGTEDITVNLNDYPSQMLIDPLTGVDIFLYGTNEDAQNHITENIIDPIQTLTGDGYLVGNPFFVRFQISDDCYTVRRVNILLVHPIPMQNPIDVCDIYNDNVENENSLSIYDTYILGDQNGTVAYFETQTDAENNQNQITNYNFTDNHTLFVRITVYNCIEIYSIDFQLVSVPPSENLTIDLGEVCDVNGNGLTELDLTVFEPEIYTQSDPVDFFYFENYDPLTEILSNPITTPELHPVTSSITFYVQIVDSNANCNAISEVVLNIDFSQNFEIAGGELYTCDIENDLNESFDLNDALPQITSTLDDFSENLYDISYHTTQENADNNIDAIVDDIFVPNSAVYPIYVRFQNLITGCVSTSIMNLYTQTPPKPRNGTYTACDDNLNGAYEVELQELINLVMANDVIEGNIYTFHLGANDAELGINAIEGVDGIYEETPFPSVIYVRAERENIPDCYDAQPVTIVQGTLTSLPTNNYDLIGCDLDNDGIATFNLTEELEIGYPLNLYNISYYESLDQIHNYENPIVDPTNYQNSEAFQTSVVAFIQEIDPDGLIYYCPDALEINLEYATISVEVETHQFCPGESTAIYPEELVTNANYGYEWFNASGELISTEMNLENITEAQSLTLVVTNLDFPTCQLEIPLEVTTYNPPVILDIVEEGSTISVVAIGDFAIEYSMDGENWQALNYFEDLEPGVYTFYVRYVEQGCLGDPMEGIIFKLNNFISPNGDGYNDYITIDNLHVFDGEECTLIIYDRYGKEIFKESSATSIIWDGKYQGRVLNTTDYWYIFRVPDGREIKGSFTVKNL